MQRLSRAEDERDQQLGAWLADPTGRCMVVVAHPDDEVLGCGALLARLDGVKIVHVTGGSPRDGDDAARHGFASPGAYAEARAAEAEAAMAHAGIPAEHLLTLGVPDQEASMHLDAITHDLARGLATADLVLTHAFEGGHSDHDAVAFAVHSACALLPRRPMLVEMPFYHAVPEGWERQRFLPQAGAGAEHVIQLDAAARALKRRMVEAHRSQAETLESFDLTAERFRLAPPYSFTKRPLAGELLYERHGWNLDWPSWVARVRAARDRAAAPTRP